MGSKRLDIKTGFNCNNNCLFCVQAHKKEYGNRPTEDLKKDMRAAFNNNCEGIVFTGGEVTIREDLLEIISYAKNLGFRRIQLQSNLRMLSYKKLCVDVIKAGANEFSPALHGHTAELHDYLTRAKGSFNQTVQAIKNLRELGQYLITNTVVVKPNYRYLPELAQLLVDLKVNQFQFAFMHAVGHAETNYDIMMARVSKAAPYMKKGLQIGIDNGLSVMAEAMPLCMMEGYERYISEIYIPETEIRDVDNSVDEDFKKTRQTQGKVKFEQCKECKYELICEGPWKEYPEKMGDSEFQPVKGEKIRSFNEILNPV